MPRPRVNREVPRTTGITVELSEYGLFIEASEPDGETRCAFVPARTLRHLATAPLAVRQRVLAQLDPACEPRCTRTAEAGSGARKRTWGVDAPPPSNTTQGVAAHEPRRK